MTTSRDKEIERLRTDANYQEKSRSQLAGDYWKANKEIDRLKKQNKKDIISVIAMTVASTILTIGLVALVVANDHVLRNTPLPQGYTVIGI